MRGGFEGLTLDEVTRLARALLDGRNGVGQSSDTPRMPTTCPNCGPATSGDLCDACILALTPAKTVIVPANGLTKGQRITELDTPDGPFHLLADVDDETGALSFYLDEEHPEDGTFTLDESFTEDAYVRVLVQR